MKFFTDNGLKFGFQGRGNQVRCQPSANNPTSNGQTREAARTRQCRRRAEPQGTDGAAHFLLATHSRPTKTVFTQGALRGCLQVVVRGGRYHSKMGESIPAGGESVRTHKPLLQQFAFLLTLSPSGTLQNICLFPRIEVALRRNVGGD